MGSLVKLFDSSLVSCVIGSRLSGDFMLAEDKM